MDLLKQPVAGALIRWPRLRITLQLVLLLVVSAAVLHGLFGPEIGPRNLATVLTSIHWRGLLVIVVLAAWNLFCTACPMMLVRDAARRVVQPKWRWPRALRRKWLAIGLFVLALFSYELWDLWGQPRATAWLIVGYFGLALLVDLAFTGATFCKYVCPVGQFNFAAATLSPTELRVRDAAVCRTCTTADCVRGRYTKAKPARLERRGCELGLFLPTKVGNLDCTMCLDCVQACPHDNIALETRVPGTEWLVPGRRSGLGRVATRADLAALALVFTFGALLNAFAMTAPAHAVHHWLGQNVGLHSEALALALLFAVGLFVLPALLVAVCAWTTDRLARATMGVRRIAMSFAYALLPLGFGIWLAHYGFHLFTGALTIVPVTQSAAIDAVGVAALGEPLWRWTGMASGAVFPIQIGVILLGAAGSIGLAHALAGHSVPKRAALAATPWIVLVTGLAVLSLWILSQPMEMRGMSVMG
jgi:ferredoxin